MGNVQGSLLQQSSQSIIIIPTQSATVTTILNPSNRSIDHLWLDRSASINRKKVKVKLNDTFRGYRPQSKPQKDYPRLEFQDHLSREQVWAIDRFVQLSLFELATLFFSYCH